MPHVYHFTDTAHLPWILESGELLPGRNRIGNYPDPDFIWATTNPQGDRTATVMEGYRKGSTALVRLTLHAEDFELWPAIIDRFPDWTRKHVRTLEAVARGADPSRWRARAESLPLSRIISADAKTYSGSWQPIDLTHVRHDGWLGIIFGETVYLSKQRVQPGRATAYEIGRASLDEWQRVNSSPAQLRRPSSA